MNLPMLPPALRVSPVAVVIPISRVPRTWVEVPYMPRSERATVAPRKVAA